MALVVGIYKKGLGRLSQKIVHIKKNVNKRKFAKNMILLVRYSQTIRLLRIKCVGSLFFKLYSALKRYQNFKSILKNPAPQILSCFFLFYTSSLNIASLIFTFFFHF